MPRARCRALAAALLAALLLPASAPAASIFQATLNSDQQVPPGGSTGSSVTGTAQLVLSATELAFDVSVGPGADFGPITGGSAGSGAEVIGFHFHTGSRATQFGPIVFGILDPDDDTDGDTVFTFNGDGSTRIQGGWDLGEGNAPFVFDDFLAGLQAAAPGADTDLYFNLHSTDDPGGLIRGQIVAVPEPSAALLLGAALAALAAPRPGVRRR